MNAKMRASSFAVFGALRKYGIGALSDAFIEQAFDAPWPIIQANAIYFYSSMLSLFDNQHILAVYHSQVFGILVGKMGRSPDAIVRATSSAALGLLLKSSNLYSLRAVQLDRLDSTRNHDAESTKN